MASTTVPVRNVKPRSALVVKCRKCKETYEMLKQFMPSCAICGFFRVEKFKCSKNCLVPDALCCSCDATSNKKNNNLHKSSLTSRTRTLSSGSLEKNDKLPSFKKQNIVGLTTCGVCGEIIQSATETLDILAKSVFASSEDHNLIDYLPFLDPTRAPLIKDSMHVSISNIRKGFTPDAKVEFMSFSIKNVVNTIGAVPVLVDGSEMVCAQLEGGCGWRMFPRGLLSRIDKDKTLELSQDEWTHYFMFHPAADVQEIINHWRHATVLDLGEDMSVPDDFTAAEVATGQWWRHLAAGGMAGAVSRTATAPMDRAKVFLQVGKGDGRHFTSIREVIAYMYKEGGLASFWRGNGMNVLKIAPESALKFAAFEQAKRFIKKHGGNPDRELKIGERFLAGSCAGVFSQTSIYPMEVVKTRLALQKSGQFRGIIDAFYQIYAREGLRAFYRGYAANVCGIIPYAGIDLAVYETLKRRFSPEDAAASKWVVTACGAVAPSCGMVTCYPLSLIRTRLQAQEPHTLGPQTPTTARAMFRQILATEGVRGLYRGIMPNFYKVIPAVSISYLVYESMRPLLGVKMS